MDWEDRLIELLLSAGLTGIKQGDIVTALRKKATADLITEVLERWWEDGMVQRFTIPSGKKGGRPSIVWRALAPLAEGE